MLSANNKTGKFSALPDPSSLSPELDDELPSSMLNFSPEETLRNALITSIEQAIQVECFDEAYRLLQQYNDESNNPRFDELLPLAAAYNQTTLVLSLLEKKASIFQCDEYGSNALQHAKNNQNLELIHILENHMSPLLEKRTSIRKDFYKFITAGNLKQIKILYNQITTNPHIFDFEFRNELMLEVSKRLIIRIVNSQPTKENRWLRVANFLNENCDEYYTAIKMLGAYFKNNEEDTAVGILFNLIVNNNIKGFNTLIEHGFPFENIQMIYKGYAFNTVQLILLLSQANTNASSFLKTLFNNNASLDVRTPELELPEYQLIKEFDLPRTTTPKSFISRMTHPQEGILLIKSHLEDKVPFNNQTDKSIATAMDLVDKLCSAQNYLRFASMIVNFEQNPELFLLLSEQATTLHLFEFMEWMLYQPKMNCRSFLSNISSENLSQFWTVFPNFKALQSKIANLETANDHTVSYSAGLGFYLNTNVDKATKQDLKFINLCNQFLQKASNRLSTLSLSEKNALINDLQKSASDHYKNQIHDWTLNSYYAAQHVLSTIEPPNAPLELAEHYIKTAELYLKIGFIESVRPGKESIVCNVLEPMLSANTTREQLHYDAGITILKAAKDLLTNQLSDEAALNYLQTHNVYKKLMAKRISAPLAASTSASGAIAKLAQKVGFFKEDTSQSKIVLPCDNLKDRVMKKQTKI